MLPWKYALAGRYYVVERAAGSLGIITNNKLTGEIKNLGNGTHIIIYFGKHYGYALSRNGYLSKIDPGTGRVILQKRVSKDTVDFCLSGKYIAVASYVPEDVIVLNKNLKVLKTIKTGDKNIGIEFYKNYLIFELMNKDRILALNTADNFKIVKTVNNIGKMPIDALIYKGFYLSSFLLGQKFGMLNLNNFTYRIIRYGKKGKFTHQIPHYGIYSVDNDKAYIPAVGEKKLEVVDLKTGNLTGSVNLPGFPIFIIFSPDRKIIAINYSGGAHDYLTLINAGNLHVVKNLKAGRRVMFMSFSRGSGHIYVSDYYGNSVNVFNTRNGKEVFKIPVQSPSGIFRVPNKLYEQQKKLGGKIK